MQWKMGQPWNMETHSAMKLNLVRVDRGWHPTQLCGDYKKPWGSLSYKQSVFHSKFLKQFFFRGEKKILTLTWGVHKMGGEVSSIFRWRKTKGILQFQLWASYGAILQWTAETSPREITKTVSNCRITLQGINISHLGKWKLTFKTALERDMLVPRRVLFNGFVLVLIWGFPGSVGCFKFGEANNPQTSSASALHLKMDVVGGQTCWVFLKCSPQHF